MTRVVGWALAATLFVLVVVASGEQATPPEKEPPKTNIQVLMRDKLLHAQGVLDGLVSEDYEQIAKHADLMGDISRAVSWQVPTTNEYRFQRDRFQRTVTRLEEAAQQQNRDGVALQYLQLTISCIDCHQYIHDQSIPEALGNPTP